MTATDSQNSNRTLAGAAGKLSMRERINRSASGARGNSRGAVDSRGYARGKDAVTDVAVRNAFQDLGKTADGMAQTFLTFRLSNTRAKDLSMLKKSGRYLQKLEIGRNEISDLSHISGKEHLVYLNVSDNQLTQLLDIPEPRPRNLRVCDFRMNMIENFTKVSEDLQSFPFLRNLALDHNLIRSAQGLSGLSGLLHLSITHNRLTSCDGLDELVSLVHLDISRNKISSLKPLSRLHRLQALIATHNEITSLDGVGTLEVLNKLDASDNKISVLQSVCDAARCPLLGNLTLTGNPAQQCMDYRLHLVHLLPQVTNLDSLLVDSKEKVHASNLHGADAAGLKVTRDRLFPDGELDDGGGAIPPIAAGLLPSDGTDHAPGSDGPEDFARVDAFIDELPMTVIQNGVLVFADYLQERITDHLELARAIYRWITRHVTFPNDGLWGQSLDAPLFSKASNLEEVLLYGATGTWSERLAQLYVALAKACHLEAVTIAGFWRHESLWPGASLIGHNHCWNAVKVNGKWRLLDCAAAAREGNLGFFTDPGQFRMTYQPLDAPWSLRRDYISNTEFFGQPWASPRLFHVGCKILSQGLKAVVELQAPKEGGWLEAPCISLAVPPGYRLEHRLLNHARVSVIPTEKLPWEITEKDWPTCHGAPSFQHVIANERGVCEVHTAAGCLRCREVQMFVALPYAPGEFYHEIFLVKDLPGAITCRIEDSDEELELTLQEKHPVLRVKYATPAPASSGDDCCPVAMHDTPQSALPLAMASWHARGAELVEPSPTMQLEADRAQTFAVIVPGAVEALVVPNDAYAGKPSVRMTRRRHQGLVEPPDHASIEGGVPMALDADTGIFSASVVLPRLPVVDIMARLESEGRWVHMLRFNVNSEVQHICERPDLVYSPAVPDEKDPSMHTVRDIMKHVDTDKDGYVSRKEYLVKIRRDRKYADFLKMPPRVREADGTFQKFNEIFMAINCARTGRISQNELAEYLGCKPLVAESSQPLTEEAPAAAETQDQLQEQSS